MTWGNLCGTTKAAPGGAANAVIRGPDQEWTLAMTHDPTSAYFDAIHQAEADLTEALSHIRAEEDAGRITPIQAATERVGLLERHLERCRRLRTEHLGGPS